MSTTLKFENFDIVRYNRGTDYVKLTGITKTKQDCAVILATNIRPITGLGSGIDSLIGVLGRDEQSPYLRVPVSFDLQNRIIGGLNALMAAQRQYLFSARTKDELIYEISPVQVWKNPSDPRVFEWNVGIQTYLITSKPVYVAGTAG